MLADRLLDGRLKLRHLVILTNVAEYGSLARAAERGHVTQPVLTRALKELETIVGVPLFDRGPKGMTPTVYGVAFIDRARAILNQVRQAGQQLTDIMGAETGTVRVGTHLAGSNVLLPKAIARLKAGRPAVTVVVKEGTPDLLLDDLKAGDLDLTVGRITPLPRTGIEVHQETLYHEPIGLVTRPAHPARALSRPRLVDLVGYPWIVPVEQTALRFELEQVFLGAGVPLPANRVESTSILTVRALLSESDFIASLPLLIVECDPDLAVLPTRLDTLRRPVGVTLVPGRVSTPAVAAFLEQLRAVAQGIVAGARFAPHPLKTTATECHSD